MANLPKELQDAEIRRDNLMESMRGMSTQHEDYGISWRMLQECKQTISRLKDEIDEAEARDKSDHYDRQTAHKS